MKLNIVDLGTASKQILGSEGIGLDAGHALGGAAF